MKSKKRKRKSTAKLLAELQVVFNRYIRLRDDGLPCISCGANHFEHASHFFPVRGNSQLRFDEDNVHGGCVNCNMFKYGNQYEYGQRLPDRIGQDRFDALLERKRLADLDVGFKWQRHEIEEKTGYYKERCKDLSG